MKTIQEMLQELSQCIVTVSGEFRFRTNWSGGKVPQPDLDTFDPNVPFCIENVGDVQASVQYNTKNTNIRISKDYKTWNDYTSGTEIELNPKDRVYIKSDYIKDTGYDPRFVFNGDGARLRARGNIASLIYGTNDTYVTKYTSTEEYCYSSMFSGCTSLTQAPDLPATSLNRTCYSTMFRGCTSLTQAPELPAITLASYCYDYMFYGCTSLTRAPELPATILASGCYSNMFYGCTGLTQAPELPATTLAERCYEGMFRGCTSLTQAPNLPTTTLNDNCYTNMFHSCTSLVQVPELPATTLAKNCYEQMFYGCASLTQTPELPATTLATDCYLYMFRGCTSLTQAPELPATTLAQNCYRDMFNFCTSLVQAPELPATILANYCYYEMFYYCKKLNNVKCLATDTSATGCMTNWLYKVASTGTFECDNKKYFTLDSPNGIPVGWTITEINPDVEKPDLDVFDPNVPFCIENVGDVQASVQYNTKNTNIKISKDYKTWNDYTTGDSITLDPTDRVYIKSDYVRDGASSPRFVFNGDSARLRARGNIASLLYGTNDIYVNKYTSTEEYCYSAMFKNCKSLVQAPELPAATLTNYCYYSMFNGCTGLIQAPDLPATTLAQYCYNSMFYDCASLTQAPELPATTLAVDCYSSMFVNCTSLTQAPELPATTLADHCYEIMFYGCTKLNYVKCLATDTSAYDCTRVWLSDVSATGDFYTPKDTRWTTDRDGIPSGWTRHDINPDPPTPPEPEKPDLDTFDPNVPFCIENVGDVPVEIGLYNVGTEAIRAKRSNCKISTDLVTWSDYNILLTQSSTDPNISKITLSNKGDRIYIKADVNTKATGSDFTKLIVINQSTDTKIRARGNIASLTYGTDDLYKSKYLTIDNHSCYSYMFAGCTSLTQAPDLPATTLYISCYERMFQNCANLKQAPELPATTLETNCYYWMFRSCKKLNYVKCFATDISAIGCTTGFLELVASTGDFYTPASTNWTTGEYGIPTGWTRHDIT